MNFTNLQYFLIVSKELNITSAARQIHISQQALSQQIHSLEAEMNTQLFTRSPKFQLTPAGVCLANAAARILDIKESTRAEIEAMNKDKPCKIRIGISPARSEALLPNLLPKFCAENPNVSFELLEGGEEITQPALEMGNLDLALLVKPDHPNFVSIQLISEILYAVMSYPLLHKYYGSQTDELIARLRSGFDFSYLRGMPLIMLRKPSLIRTIFDERLAEKEVTPYVLLETANVQTALELAKAGIGATLYPDLFLSQSTQRFAYPNMLYFPLGPYDPLVACYNPKFPLSSAAGRFLNYLQRYLSDVLTTL